MTPEEKKLADRQKFIDSLWHSLHDMAFLDIKRASEGKSKMGAFILASCIIDYLAGFRYGKHTKGLDYVRFAKYYLNDDYDASKLYQDLRCKLVHNYSEGGSYAFTDNHPELHKVKISDGRIMLNLEDFVSDVENAMNKYFDELRSDDELFKLAQTRYDKLGILTIIELN
jgi:hypothetical protein